MTFQRGRSKTGGRKTGTPNKSSHLLEIELKEYGLSPVSELVKLLPKLAESKRADILIRLLDFIYPKRKSIELNSSDTTEQDNEHLESLTAQMNLVLKDILEQKSYDNRIIVFKEREGPLDQF